MKVIVGAGNPGRRYENTRHNAGLMILREFARQARITLKRRRYRSLAGEGVVSGEPVLLLAPRTYMNLTGEAVQLAMADLQLAPGSLLVLVDDVELPLGRIRLRRSGSSGGHNGLKSVEAALGTRGYPRLRFGIGREATGELADYVLDRFVPAEEEVLTPALGQAAAAVHCWLTAGIAAAMNRFNG